MYKLTHVQKNTKVYWTLLKRFFNNKKIPLIPPLFHGDGYVDFKKKAELFNSFFTKQCSLISNNSELLLNLDYTTEKHLNILNFTDNDIEKIMQNVDPNKAHGHDKISISVIKIFGKSIWKPLQSMLWHWLFSIRMEKSQCSTKSIRKVISNVWKITDQSHCFQFAGKYLRD